MPAVQRIEAGEAEVWLFALPAGSGQGPGRAVGRGLLRTVLSATSGDGTPPERWRFATGPFGKPHVVEPSPDLVRFSVSYGDDAVAVAVSRQGDVGVDIEPLAPQGAAEIPWSELCAAERIRLGATPADERYECFIRMWTLKEAFAKCAGRGAFIGFSTVETTFDPPGVVTAGDAIPLHQEEVEIDCRRHALALCTSRCLRAGHAALRVSVETR